MRPTKILSISLLFIFVISLSTSISSKAEPFSAVIDYEGIPPGTIVDTLYSGYGISGDPIEGNVIVDGFNPIFGEDVNAAMIFDATCPPDFEPDDCSGGDYDLFNYDFGNTLIISEDMDSSDPDDADVVGAVFGFDFTHLDIGENPECDGDFGVFITDLEVQDVEEEETEDARIYFFEGGLDGQERFSVDIPETGDGVALVVPVNTDCVDAIRVDLQGSGTINNIRFGGDTAVTLLYFRVDSTTHGNVKLTWATAAEIDNYGFKIYRAPDRDFSSAEEIHFEPAGGGTGGHTYFFTDTPPGNGPWVYWLTDIDTSGKEIIHMPVMVKAVMSYVNYLPMLVVNR